MPDTYRRRARFGPSSLFTGPQKDNCIVMFFRFIPVLWPIIRPCNHVLELVMTRIWSIFLLWMIQSFSKISAILFLSAILSEQVGISRWCYVYTFQFCVHVVCYVYIFSVFYVFLSLCLSFFVFLFIINALQPLPFFVLNSETHGFLSWSASTFHWSSSTFHWSSSTELSNMHAYVDLILCLSLWWCSWLFLVFYRVAQLWVF